MRVLIVGTSYVHGAAAAEVFRMWAYITRRVNPDTEILVMDSASPTPVAPMPDTGFNLIRFADNIGRLLIDGRDGWGRSFSSALDHAIEHEYEWIVHIECDVLFARPVREVIAKMLANGVKAAAPMAIPYQFIETGLMFLNVAYLQKIGFALKYDWRNAPVMPFTEKRILDICSEAMFALPLRGFRNDMRVTAEQLPRMFPDGIDWITHAELPVLRRFLEMNNL